MSGYQVNVPQGSHGVPALHTRGQCHPRGLAWSGPVHMIWKVTLSEGSFGQLPFMSEAVVSTPEVASQPESRALMVRLCDQLCILPTLMTAYIVFECYLSDHIDHLRAARGYLGYLQMEDLREVGDSCSCLVGQGFSGHQKLVDLLTGSKRALVAVLGSWDSQGL